MSGGGFGRRTVSPPTPPPSPWPLLCSRREDRIHTHAPMIHARKCRCYCQMFRARMVVYSCYTTSCPYRVVRWSVVYHIISSFTRPSQRMYSMCPTYFSPALYPVFLFVCFFHIPVPSWKAEGHILRRTVPAPGPALVDRVNDHGEVGGTGGRDGVVRTVISLCPLIV